MEVEGRQQTSAADVQSLTVTEASHSQSFIIKAGEDSLEDLVVVLADLDGTELRLSISSIDIGDEDDPASKDIAALNSIVNKLQATPGYGSSSYTVSNVDDGQLNITRNDGAAFTASFEAGPSGYNGTLSTFVPRLSLTSVYI